MVRSKSRVSSRLSKLAIALLAAAFETVWIAKHHLKQAEAAEVLMVSRPRVSDVVNKKTAKFTIDTLVEMLSRVGKPVKLAIG